MDDRRLSVRQMLLMFVGGVAVCAVFFALGFLVGYNQRPAVATAETEQIQAPAAIPPTVNAPPDTSPSSAAVTPTSSQAPTSEAGQPTAQSASKSTEPQTEMIDTPAASGAARLPKKAISDAGPSSEASSAVPAEGRPGSGFLLQVAALNSRQDAERQVEKLNTRGYHHVSIVSPKDAHQSDSLWRILVGPYPTRLQAEQVQKRLAQAGYHPFFRH